MKLVFPADQAVIAQGLVAAAREMGVKLIRSAYSPVVREASDCAAALLDRHGNVVAQAELIPMQLGSIGATFKPCAELFPPETLVEGDFYINNDPYHGGQHLPDVFLFSPIFLDGALIGFAATVAHHLDLGGGAPGLNPQASDVHQEGLIIPPSKYNHARDWSGGPLERLIRANIRVPTQTIGDFNAQFAANFCGAERLRALCAKFGPGTVDAAMAELLDYSERRMRRAIAQAPDGVYYGADAVDDDGIGDQPLPVHATVTIAGDSVHVDFAGTSDQVATNVNCPFASTVATALTVVKSVLTSPDIPFNEGSMRPVTVAAPYGCILNPKPPAPVRARLTSSYRAYNAVMKAMAQAVPDKVIATGFDTTEAICLSHLGPDGYRISLEIFGGGYGAGPEQDGCDAVDSPMSNCGNVPVEALDLEYDFFRVSAYGLRQGSGGPGRSRGGLGLIRHYEILADDVTFATYSDRFRLAPQGLFGGEPGQCAATRVKRGNQIIDLPSKCSFALRKGDVLMIETGGGGGYGAPESPGAA
ncbi:MAG: Acetophenone carboxylase delta subunit [Alphaproteobacteria bacterium MarineAlpha10_Bin3]|jgi:N-methylhydantoinase B|nr:MAG: Acetophenone carboxylase delta subunit [Alphaproteobacteria bacterium MarineAlpha10_Bin3]PPR73856.1 MAG: Acetophenone carboxylase delta subunit [Alphaproteobacteria bacterium MarineAlpha4_Bin1]